MGLLGYSRNHVTWIKGSQRLVRRFSYIAGLQKRGEKQKGSILGKYLSRAWPLAQSEYIKSREI